MPSGMLLAIVEKRNDGIGDVGNHDMVLKRSTDLGKTWSPEQVIVDDGTKTCTDTTLCFDRQTGRLFAFFLKDKRSSPTCRATMRENLAGTNGHSPTGHQARVGRRSGRRGDKAESTTDRESGKILQSRRMEGRLTQRYGVGLAMPAFS